MTRRTAVLIILCSGFPAASLSAADAPRVVYTKDFPGSNPAYVAITLSQDGTALYNESKDPDNDEKIRLEASRVRQIFELAEKLDHFKKPLESGLKVANMGQKTLRWEDGEGKSESIFNYSISEDARALTAQFENIVDSARLLIEFKRVLRYDRLGVNAMVNRSWLLWEGKRLATTQDLLPMLDQVAKNESYIHMARERAAQLADAIRAAGN
jgi:hypothetical protein